MQAMKRSLPAALFLILSLAGAGCNGSKTDTTKYTTQTIMETDNFGQTNSGWPNDAAQSGDYRCYDNGVYLMGLTTSKTGYFAVPYAKYKMKADDETSGYTVSVAVQNGNPNTDMVGGLYFNSSGSDGVFFVVAPQAQKYAIAVVKNGQSSLKWRDFGQELQTGTISETGFTTLTAKVENKQATLYINGNAVSTRNVPVHLGGEKVGLYLSTNESDAKKDVKAYFDNFQVNGTAIIAN